MPYYTTPTAISRQKALAEALRTKKMGKHGAGGRTGIGDGLAYMLNQYSAAKMGKEADGKEAANAKLEALEFAAALRGESGVGGAPEQQITGQQAPIEDGGYGTLKGWDNGFAQDPEGLTTFAGGQAPESFQTPLGQQAYMQQAQALQKRDQSQEDWIRDRTAKQQDMEAEFGYQQKLQASEPFTLSPQSERYGGPPVDGLSPKTAENTNVYGGDSLGGINSRAKVVSVNTLERGIVLLYPDGRITDTAGNPIAERLTRTQDDPTLQGGIAREKAAGNMTGKTVAERGLNAPAQVAVYDDMLGTVDAILDPQNEDAFNSTFGSIDPLVPSVLSGTVDMEAKVKQLVSFLSVDARERMKGSGAISDYEAKTLAASVTILSNPRVSQEAARTEMLKVQSILKRARDRNLGYLPMEEGRSSAPTDRRAQLMAELEEARAREASGN